MHFSLIAAATLTRLAFAASFPEPQTIFSNIISEDGTMTYNIPTVHESAIQARRIFHLESVGTLSTIFPDVHPSENRPAEVSGSPIGLMDYFADCEPSSGNPTILAIKIATSFKNVAAGSNITLSMRWHPPSLRHYSPASLPRFSLVGRLEELSKEAIENAGVSMCFVGYHPDAVAWLPGNKIHESSWVRLVVEDIYWIGGFGDRAYIGWIPAEEWRGVTKKEIEECRLPGEKKGWSWRSWLGEL